ncbi:TolB family protein [Cohnella hongkongensis]|uniref:TolB protein n=1 Tax=Cohnella hongkongensis TaxID=178337 RepID=A0ABV9FEL7_9BACL
MKISARMMTVPALLFALAACSSEGSGNRTIIKEPGMTITVIDDAGSRTGEPGVSVEKMDRLDGTEIMDWVDESTVVVSKENESLGRMALAELADSYPRSLYLYDLDTRQYTLLQQRKNLNIGGAVLSPDKKRLIYHEYSLGDPVYSVMNLDTLDSFRLTGDPIGGAVSANWADSETIVGAAYSGGAYIATSEGRIAAIDQLEETGLILVEKVGDILYYNTLADESLKALNLVTLEKTSLNLDRVIKALPSPDGRQLLALQINGSRTSLLLCDANGENRKTIAEGTELSGISWSPDQRMIAYGLNADASGTAAKGLYLYDMLTDESVRIAVDIEPAATSWSPSGQRLAYTEWNAKPYRSGIVQLHYSLRK